MASPHFSTWKPCLLPSVWDPNWVLLSIYPWWAFAYERLRVTSSGPHLVGRRHWINPGLKSKGHVWFLWYFCQALFLINCLMRSWCLHFCALSSSLQNLSLCGHLNCEMSFPLLLERAMSPGTHPKSGWSPILESELSFPEASSLVGTQMTDWVFLEYVLGGRDSAIQFEPDSIQKLHWAPFACMVC